MTQLAPPPPKRASTPGLERLLATVRVIQQLHADALAAEPEADPERLLRDVVRRVQPHAAKSTTWA